MHAYREESATRPERRTHMDCMDMATVASFDTHWEVRFGLRYDIARTGDSVVFTLEGQSGWELTVRIERGRIADVAVWDARRARRVSLPFESVVVGSCEVICVVPTALLVPEHALSRVQLNGALAGMSTVAWRDSVVAPERLREFASA
jgi:hypothetical protein